MRDLENSKRKVLIVFSKTNSDTSQLESNEGYGTNLISNEYLEFDFLVDPSRDALELSLQDNVYSCIIPCTSHSLRVELNDKYMMYDFNILRVLNNRELDYCGNTYLKDIMLADQSACLLQSKIGIPQKIITRYQNSSRQSNLKSLKNHLPLLLTPSYSKMVVSRHYWQADSVETAERIISDLFEKDELVDEILVCGHTRCDTRIIVTIIGNPPLSVEFVYDTSLNAALKNDESISVRQCRHKIDAVT